METMTYYRADNIDESREPFIYYVLGYHLRAENCLLKRELSKDCFFYADRSAPAKDNDLIMMLYSGGTIVGRIFINDTKPDYLILPIDTRQKPVTVSKYKPECTIVKITHFQDKL